MHRPAVRYIGGIVFVLFWVAACDETPPPPKAAAKLGSRVELAAGEVRLTSEKGDGTRLITGALLNEKSALTVGPGGRALIRLNSGAKVFIKEKTSVEIDGDDLLLRSGEVWVDVPAFADGAMAVFKAGEVTVTAEDAGIDLAADGKQTRIYTARGLAAVSGPGGRAEVESGEQVVFKGKAPPKVSPVAFWEDWTGGLADRSLSAGEYGQGAGTLYGIDRANPGAAPEALQITAQNIFVTVRDGIAHTVVDQRFFNPSSVPLEGFYWFTAPEGASVHRFALEVNGALVDGEIVERKQAAAAYEEAVARAFDPALLEWVDGRSYRARIFPIPAAGERRVVLSYFETLPLADGAYRYVYPAASTGATVQEYALTVDLGEEGESFEVKTQEDAKVEADGRKISMRRSGYRPQADFLLELRPKEEKESVRVQRFPGRDGEADYVMMRFSPEVEWQKLTQVTGDVVMVMDTSAGGDEADRQVRQDTMEAVLRALSDDDRFAVVTADLTPKIIYPKKGLAPADEAHVSEAVERLAEVTSAGATDLGAVFGEALKLVHGALQPAVVYVGDGNATVGETGSDALADRLRRSLGESRARLFTIAVGQDADLPLLERLARLGGGRSFVISNAAQTVQEALRFVGMLKTPTLTDLHIDAGKGLDQVFISAAGKMSEGDEAVLLARTHHALPEKISVSGSLGKTPFEKSYSVKEEKNAAFGFIATLWAGQYLRSLMQSGREENRGRIIALGLSYSLMTPFTSFLVLESNAAYQQQGIQRRNRYRFSELESLGAEPQLAAADGVGFPLLGLMGCSDKSEAPPMMSEKADEMRMPSAPAGAMGQAETESAPVALTPEPSSSASAVGGRGGGPMEEGRVDHNKESKPRAKKSSASSKRRAKDDHYGLLGPKDKGGVADMDDEVAAPKIPTVRNERAETKKLFVTAACSDASRRPLRERRMLWQRRLRMTRDASEYHHIFRQAGEACELPTQRDRRALLNLIDERVHSADDVSLLLSTFQETPWAARYLRNRILRRAFDPDQLLGNAPGETFWPAFRAGVLALKSLEDREKKLREFLEKNEGHVQAREMLTELLFEENKNRDAALEARRLRREGAASPKILELLCDFEASENRVEAARRTCSELVEFNPNDPKAHERLGDIFLRRGWYAEAYRQYTGLVEMLNDVPYALLRLAAAAAGMGKVDEALRIERKVASGDGEPGPNDPRRIARLHSAARLAQLLLKAKNEGGADPEAVARNLKRTQILSPNTTAVFLVWEDYDVSLGITANEGAPALAPIETVVSPETGLLMLDLGRDTVRLDTLQVRVQSLTPRRPVSYVLLLVSFDGKSYSVEQRTADILVQNS